MRRARTALAFAAVTVLTVGASAQPKRRPRLEVEPSTPPTVASGPTNLRAHVGTEHASRLLRSTDPDERIRGIARAADIGTPEAVALLVSAAEGGSTVRSDSRALVALARALAPFAEQDRARTALLGIVNVGSPGLAGRLPQPGRGGGAIAGEDGDPLARTELAREIAAIALARSGSERALELLYGTARAGGSGQAAAMLALAVQPPRDPGFFGAAGASLPAPVVRLLGQLGDLRALEVVHAAARSTDVATRAAGLTALAELGDERAIPLARTAIVEADARLRAAAGDVLVTLAAPERVKAVSALVSDEATTQIGIHLAERVHHPEITKLLAARAHAHPDRTVRAAAVRALGRSPDAAAAEALAAPVLLGDAGLAYDAALALARSPSSAARARIAAIATGPRRDLALRAYVVRALVRGERDEALDEALARAARSPKPEERALGVLARVALGDDSARTYLADPDARVRRAAALGTLARPSSDDARALLEQMPKEPDPVTRQVFALGLSGGDPDGLVPTNRLVDRAQGGGPDAPLATYALARRADETTADAVSQLLGSKDPVLRAHAARGLGAARLPDASGRLADAYVYETEPEVRRALIAALGQRGQDASAPARRRTLELAARLDPDGFVRQIARRALDGARAAPAASLTHEVAWLRVTQSDGAAPGSSFAAALVRADGVAVPIAFDDEGFALVAGVPPGDARLVLAPRLPSYEAGSR